MQVLMRLCTEHAQGGIHDSSHTPVGYKIDLKGSNSPPGTVPTDGYEAPSTIQSAVQSQGCTVCVCVCGSFSLRRVRFCAAKITCSGLFKALPSV